MSLQDHDKNERLRETIENLPAQPAGTRQARQQELLANHVEEVLTAHFLHVVECDHNSHRDKAACGCGWTSEYEPSVGHAVRTWAKHAISLMDLAPHPSGSAQQPEPLKEQCAAMPTADPPVNCDFPFCGCFKIATKALETLQECGWGPAKPNRPDVLEALREGIALTESASAHVSHGGPTRADAERWLDKARKAAK